MARHHHEAMLGWQRDLWRAAAHAELVAASAEGHAEYLLAESEKAVAAARGARAQAERAWGTVIAAAKASVRGHPDQARLLP